MNEVSPHKTKSGYRLVEVDLIIPFEGSVRILDESCMDDFDERVVSFTTELPDAFFEPVSIKIKPPEELVQSIVGEMEQVEIPIVLDHNKDDIAKVIVEHNLKEEIVGQKNGILLGVLKRTVKYLEGKK